MTAFGPGDARRRSRSCVSLRNSGANRQSLCAGRVIRGCAPAAGLALPSNSGHCAGPLRGRDVRRLGSRGVESPARAFSARFYRRRVGRRLEWVGHRGRVFHRGTHRGVDGSGHGRHHAALVAPQRDSTARCPASKSQGTVRAIPSPHPVWTYGGGGSAAAADSPYIRTATRVRSAT